MECTHLEESSHAAPCLLQLDVKGQKRDYISQLPNCMLSQVQSMLSMNDMMNTCILSKRWCNLWHLRRDLNFDVHNVFGSEEELLKRGYLAMDKDYEYLRKDISDVCKDEFIRRVNLFVKNFKGIVIDSFMVKFDNLKHNHSKNIDEWIKFAISRGVGRIDLLLYQKPGHYKGTRYTFPFGLSFDCKRSTLKHMHLVDCKLDCHPSKFDIFPFTNLRSLVLQRSRVDLKLLTALLSNCVLLEELSLESCKVYSSSLKIVSSSLCHLKLRWCKASKDEELEFISLDCLKLTSFYSCHMNPSQRISMNTPILKTIDHFDCPRGIHNAFSFIETVPTLEILNLCIYYNCCPCSSSKVTSIPLKTTLKNLRELNLRVVSQIKWEFDIWWILDVLEVSPCLQKLSVMIECPSFDEKQRDIQDRIRFTHNEIKVIELGGCVGNWYEIEFAMNALKYIHTLERIVLSPYCKDEMSPNNDQRWDPSWPNGRKRILKKLQDKGIELNKLVLL